MKILLIEPDKKLAGIYQGALEKSGHTVSWAAHAQDAISLSDESKPNLVLLELQLAGHNGIEFLYEFRSYAEWQHVPVILLTLVTPHALTINADSMEALGVVRCLYKPATTLKQLCGVVNEQLELARSVSIG